MSMSINRPNGIASSADEAERVRSPDQKRGIPTPGQPSSVADPQVKPKKNNAPRRSFDPAYKSRILAAYDVCSNIAERGALLRREGLYHSCIIAWRKQQARGKLKAKTSGNTPRMDHLLHENAQLKKKLAQAEAILELQKKVSELLGNHILPHETSEVRS